MLNYIVIKFGIFILTSKLNDEYNHGANYYNITFCCALRLRYAGVVWFSMKKRKRRNCSISV